MLRILDRIYLGAASASSGGGSVDESRIIVKSATIPTAGEDYLGSVYMYVGETNSTYTHGYIYECVENGSTYAWERIDVQPGATRGRFLALWNCATGLAESNPPSSPYPYGAGDYYIVGTVGTTNYKPSGSSYVIGTASTTVETDDVAVNDTYYYDGTNWNLQKNTATTVDQNYDPTSINAQSGTAVAQAIAGITIPTVNDATLTISQNGVLKGVFTANSSTNVNVLLENLPADFINNQNSAQTATTPLKVWEGTSSDYADQTSSTGTFYAWDMGSGGWTAYTMEYPITNSSVIYWYSAGDYGPTSNTIIYTDGTAMFVRDDYEEFHYAPEKNIGGNNIGPDTICFVEGEGIKRNGVDIANLSSSSTTAEEIVNANEATGATSPLKVWQGTEQEWTNGKGTDWYCWKTDAIQNFVSYGDPTIENHILDLDSPNKYISQNLTQPSTLTSIEIVIKTKVNQITQQTGTSDFIILRDNYYCLGIGVNNVNSRIFGRVGAELNGQLITTTYTDVLDYKWYKLSWSTTTAATLSVSNNGVDYTIIGTYSMTTGQGFSRLGIYGNSNLNNYVDLDNTYIKVNGELFWTPYTETESPVYTTETEPTTTSTVYSEPNTASALTITSVGTGTITLSDNNTYTYTSSGDVTTYQTIGDAYPNYLANINGVGVKIGNTLIADNTDTSTLQTTTNLVTSVSSSSTDTQYPSAKLLYDTVGNIEATLDAIIAQGSNS